MRAQHGVEVWMRVKDRQLFARLMVTQGWTERRLAQAVGVSPAMIGHFRRGKAGRDVTCTPRTAMITAQVLGVPVDLLFVTTVSRHKGQNGKAGHAAAVSA